MGIGGALMQNPRFRKQIMEQNKQTDPATEQQKQTAADIRNFGLMSAYYGRPAAAQRMNAALRVRASEFSPSTARRMNRKGG
jgi:hypothetical protein